MTDQHDIAGLRGTPVFVCGASGFIGRHLVAALAAAGAQVSVLARGRGAQPPGVRVVAGRLEDAAAWGGALAGTAVLFNLAYDVRATGAANLAAFHALIGAAETRGVGRIVHTSSIVVYDGWPARDLDETGTKARPGGSPYRRAKIEMERRLAAGPLPAAILQPTIVYGPDSGLWTDGLATALATGGVVLPQPEGICNGVHVGDLVQALLRAAVVPGLGQERFIVNGPAPFAWSALLQGYAGLMGKGAVTFAPLAELQARLGPKPDETAEDSGPSRAAQISAIGRRVLGRARFEGLVRMAKRRLGRGGALYPDHHLLEVFSGTGICSIGQARGRLGYHPDLDLARGLAATATHLQNLSRTL